MKVYVITAGQYSDYHIERIFTDKTLAEEYYKQQKNDPSADVNDITEWETDQDFERKDTFVYDVLMIFKKFGVAPAKDFAELEGIGRIYCMKNYPKSQVNAIFLTRCNCCCEIEYDMHFIIEAKSKELARAIAIERLAQVKALLNTHFPELFNGVRYNFITKQEL